MSSLAPAIPTTSLTKGSLLARSIKLAITFSMMLLIYNDIFGGVIKYYSASSSLLFISFIPTLFAGVVLAGYLGTHLMVMRLHIRVAVFLLIFILNAFYAIIIGRQPEAVGFAFYIWLPFFTGLLITTFKLQDEFKKQIVIWWLIATVGVLLNSQIKFPWIGESYQVLGQTVQTARDWTAIGFDRLAGFSRASYAVANQIAIFSMVILTMRISLLKKLVVWTISAVAVYLTTTKITLFIMIIVPILTGLVGYFQRKSQQPTPTRQTIQLAFVIITVLASLMVLLPVFSLTSRSSISTGQSLGFISFDSLFERMWRMWPDAWNLIFSDSNPILIIFGRGLGGIGTPQMFYEALKQNSADNFFVYIYVTFGMMSVFFIRYLVINIKKWATTRNATFQTYFALTVTTIMIGITANIVENATALLVLGLLLGKTGTKSNQLSNPIT
ncbi:MAG: hypothetical protein K2Q32_03125 [Alphaproteobacteria bacterium]|nr:hypothetical protein [Alphaproteobacteria bacterium]